MKSTDWVVPKHSTRWKVFCAITTAFVGLTGKFWTKILNHTECHNLNEFLELTTKRAKGKPLVTVSNHDSCLDDPLLFVASQPLSTFFVYDKKENFRWTLGAREVCFTKPWHSLFFRSGQVLPVIRGNGVYQKSMNDVLEYEVNKGGWLHLFSEGKVNDKKEFLRLKWGVGRIVSDAKVTPIVLPFFHFGMDDILPNKEPYRPQIGKKLTIVFGKAMYFDEIVNEMKKLKKSPVEIRKYITDCIQEEYYKLKAEAEKIHKKHLGTI